MPQLDIQRTERSGGVLAWVWIAAAILAGLLLWWVIAAATDRDNFAAVPPNEQVAGERLETPAAPVVPDTDVTAPDAQMPGVTPEPLPLAGILATPTDFFGDPVAGMATVTEVVSDRGFWVESDGNRMFVVKDEALPEQGLK